MITCHKIGAWPTRTQHLIICYKINKI